ncbi:CidA/LrgA family protein [Paenibacillus chondroitinus]|uniref:CidA/LrgA family protein n=1 Tax=Paenibacillus chondroitinus TaxID=59842 RepID=A0ABU6D5M1_9BACL|nr:MULTISPECIES: CidA/LrgA family protein [Paenibacillus]MCY9660107.1 CidA/LrgA family protein [Paenibacillus anseongense]MEB4793034.1 CidA/LrgA family protein [Paenibacillus chondroitinus]
MRGFAILLGFNMLGIALQHFAYIPLPGNVIGLLLFTLALFSGIVRLEWVETSTQFLLRHMLAFFVPYIVGILAIWPLLQSMLLQIALSLVVSTLVGLLVSGWVTSAMLKKREVSSGG